MNLAEYKGVYVFAQQVDNEVSSIALELIGKGKDLAKDLGTTVTAVLVGSGVKGLADEGNTVSKTTVYRSLEFFCLDGSVMRFTNDSGESATYRYAGGHCSHFHIKCTECGSTACVDCSFADSIQEHLLSHHGFTVNQGMSIFYGVCAPCRSKSIRTGP